MLTGKLLLYSCKLQEIQWLLLFFQKRDAVFCHVDVCVTPSAACSLICGLLSLEPPSFVQRLEDISCLVGSEFSMKCMLSGSLPMTFSWIKDDHELTEDEHVKMSYDTKSAVLNLRNAQLSHGGKYVCQAQNKAGTQRCAAMVIVTGL